MQLAIPYQATKSYMRCYQGVNTTTCTGQEDSRTCDGSAHRSGQDTREINEGHAPPAVNEFESSSEEELNQQIHHQVHDSNVDEHVSHEAPGFLASVGIVDEKDGGGSIGSYSDMFHTFVAVISARFRFENCPNAIKKLHLLSRNDVVHENGHFNNAEDCHRQWRREKLHLTFVGSV